MPRKQHEACAELVVNLNVGEEFDWVTTTSEYCDIHILDDHPLDQDRYHVVKGTPTPAKAIGSPGKYEFECSCKHRIKTNPKIIIS